MKNKNRRHFYNVSLCNGDALKLYDEWPAPRIIISDGGYGVSGFKGDAHEPSRLNEWYKSHIEAWSEHALPGTTLWFWNTEIGWATVHPLLEEYGWDYVCCNIWNKGLQHIAGNCNLERLKNFPIVTEVCVQYVKKPLFRVDGENLTLKEWLRYEWVRTGLTLAATNKACGVANAATRKYFTKDHNWYAPPPPIFKKLVQYANQYGNEEGKPYFSVNSKSPMSVQQYQSLFAKFEGTYGITNVWDHPPLHNGERIKLSGSKKCAHLNQKPLKIFKMLIEVSSDSHGMLWEPFGGLCTGGLAAYLLNRPACCAEIDKKIFEVAVSRFESYTTSLFDNPSHQNTKSLMETSNNAV